MTQKLTEEQQRAAHKIIVANRGDCAKIDNYLNCHDCPKGDDESCDACVNFPRFPEFRAENLRTSQAWLDEHPATPQEPPKRRPTPEEMVIGATVEPEPVEKAPTEEKKSEFIAKGKVDNLPSELRFINFGNLLPIDGLRIVDLENQVKDLTKKLSASERKCKKLQRRLRAKWEAARDSEMATAEEIEAWHRSGKGVVIINRPSKILYNGHTTWIPATRGNLKL